MSLIMLARSLRMNRERNGQRASFFLPIVLAHFRWSHWRLASIVPGRTSGINILIFEQFKRTLRMPVSSALASLGQSQPVRSAKIRSSRVELAASLPAACQTLAAPAGEAVCCFTRPADGGAGILKKAAACFAKEST